MSNALNYIPKQALKRACVATREEEYGIFEADLERNFYRQRYMNIRGVSHKSLEELAKIVASQQYQPNSFTFEKHEFFPDVNIEGKLVYTYLELSPNERNAFLLYLQRTLSGEPAKKRHNPEITQDDLEQAMREQNDDEN